MSSLSQSALQLSVLGIPVVSFAKEVLFGTLALIAILIFHGTGINHVIMKFDRRTKFNLSKGKYNSVFVDFYFAFIVFALIHICGIVLWSFYLFGLGLLDDGVQALIFSGSCYTTVGFAADTLPTGWRSLAFFIAFTGLFSIAWTTSVMIGMTDAYKTAWNLRYARDDLPTA